MAQPIYPQLRNFPCVLALALRADFVAKVGCIRWIFVSHSAEGDRL
jgi:hypothetical protein